MDIGVFVTNLFKQLMVTVTSYMSMIGLLTPMLLFVLISIVFGLVKVGSNK